MRRFYLALTPPLALSVGLAGCTPGPGVPVAGRTAAITPGQTTLTVKVLDNDSASLVLSNGSGLVSTNGSAYGLRSMASGTCNAAKLVLSGPGLAEDQVQDLCFDSESTLLYRAPFDGLQPGATYSLTLTLQNADGTALGTPHVVTVSTLSTASQSLDVIIDGSTGGATPPIQIGKVHPDHDPGDAAPPPDDDPPAGQGPYVLAVNPPAAAAGQQITLEGGGWGPRPKVIFPGGITVRPTILGPSRLAVLVPSGAQSGAPAVRWGHVAASGPSLQVTAGSGVGAFSAAGTLSTPRQSEGTALVGSTLYVIGGGVNSGGANISTDSVEAAPLTANGLGTFAPVPGVTLNTPRYTFGTVQLGNNLYVIGGRETQLPYPGQLGSLERAVVQPDGTIGSFLSVSGVVLSSPRYLFATVVLGDWLYVIGGYDGAIMDTVERASIAPDGTLGAFAPDSAATLAEPLDDMGWAVEGSTLYLVDGNDDHPTTKVQAAPIAGDGTLGSFMPVDAGSGGIGVYGPAFATVGDAFYLLGGSDYLAGLANAQLLTLSDGASAASPAGLMPVARWRSAATVIGSTLYVLGGKDTPGVSHDEVSSAPLQ